MERPSSILVAIADAAARAKWFGAFAEIGYRVVDADQTQAALAWLRARPVDVVLLDLQLPGGGGWPILEDLAAAPAIDTAGTAVVVLSEPGDPHELAAVLAAGAHDYVVKPGSALEVHARVTAALQAKQARDDLVRRTAELEGQHHFLAALLDSLQEGIVACDESGHITLVNTATSKAMVGNSFDVSAFFRRHAIFQADGVTPMSALESPLARALAGELVRGTEMVVVADGGQPRILVANGRAIRRSDGQKLGAVVALHDVTERRAAESELAHRALHDPLCGLPNRLLLLDRLRAALRRGERDGKQPAVLFIDIDRFKAVNDSLGHEVGDEVLRAVAGRLTTAVRPADTVSRLGGDEFVVLAEEVASLVEARVVATRLREAMAEPLPLDTGPVRVTLSIGVTVGIGPGETPEALVQRADAAMYLAKQAGRDRIEVQAG
jgi:diguanylate cyclase (GGDEF)-like protein